MTDRKRLLLLASIMATACLVVATITIYMLYDAAFAEEGARLVESAKSQVQLMEAVARFDSIYSREFMHNPG